MGTQVTSSTQQSTATPMEDKLNQQQYDNIAFMQPYAQQNYADLSKNISAILQGNTPMAKGIGGVSEEDTNNMANAAVRGVLPQFQSAGILDSGIAVQGATRAAADIRNQNAQFNTSANQNLFNLASGGQSNLQAQQQASTNSLGSQLAGLRSINQTQSVAANPFTTAASLMQGVGSMASAGFMI